MSNFSQFFGSAAGTGFPIGAAVDVFGNGYDDATWLKANGRIVAQADYPALYQSIGILASSMTATSLLSAAAPSGSGGWSYEPERTNLAQPGAVAASDSGGISFGMMARATTNGIVGFSSADGVTWATMRADWPQSQYVSGSRFNAWAIGGYRKGVFTGTDLLDATWSPSGAFTQYVVWNGAGTTLYSLPAQLYVRSCAANSNYYYLMVKNNTVSRLELYRGAYGSPIGSAPIWQSAAGDGPISSWAVVGSHVYIAFGGSFVSTDNGDSFSNLGAISNPPLSIRSFQAAVTRKGATSVILVANGGSTSEVALPSDYPPENAGSYSAYVEAGYLYFYARLPTPIVLRRKPLANLSASWEQVPSPPNFIDSGYYLNGTGHIQAGNFWFSNAGKVLHAPEYVATQASPQVLQFPFVLASFNNRHFAMGTSQVGATEPMKLLELTPPYDDATMFQIPKATPSDPQRSTMIRAR